MADKVPHYILSEGGKVGIMLPDSYDNIKDIVGVKKVSAGVAGVGADKLSVMTNADDLKRSGVALSLYCNVKYSSGDTKRRKILCAFKNVSAAMGELIGKTYDGGTIRSASVKRDRTLY